MQFTTTQKQLKAALTQAIKTCPSKPSCPVLKNVLIRASGDAVALETTDAQVWQAIPVDGAIATSYGQCLVEARALNKVLKAFKGGISIGFDNGSLSLTGDGVTYELPAQGLDGEWPAPEALKQPDALRFEVGKLRGAIAGVLPAVSTDPRQRILMAACLISTAKHGLELAGANGHILIVSKLGEALEGGDRILLLPSEALAQLERRLSNSGIVSLYRDDRSFEFCWDGLNRVSGCFTKGRYPDFHQIIPTDTLTAKASFDKKAAIAAISKVSALKSDAITALGVTEEQLTLSAQLPDSATATCSFDLNSARNFSEIRFKADRLQTVLKAMQTEDVVLETDDPKSPALMTSSDRQQYAVIMPIAKR